MKSSPVAPAGPASAIVRLASDEAAAAAAQAAASQAGPGQSAAGAGTATTTATAAATTAAAAPAIADPLARARAFAEPLLAGQALDTGEDALAHADGVAAVLKSVGASPALAATSYLVYAGDYLQRPEDVLRKAFGEHAARLVALTRQLVQIQRTARATVAAGDERAQQVERVRKMLLAFSRDLRVVLLRLASRLQTLRWHAASHRPCPPELATESLQVFAPLANRLGIWQIKWEIEDLSFRFLQPEDYRQVAALVHEKRTEREQGVERSRQKLARLLAEAGIRADVLGRPKHLYSIWRKMRGKGLDFARVLDARALRVIVDDTATCYSVLARVHERWRAVAGEFDDYIARPKANGYQSLHTVVTADDGRALEVQIRTRAMHEHAEHGVAAHWMYKEAGAKGYAGVGAGKGSAGSAGIGEFEERVAEARKAVLRELLAWQRDAAGGGEDAADDREAAPAAQAAQAAPAMKAAKSARAQLAAEGTFDDRIYVFTPQATIIDLPLDGTPVDFAYALHTELGHRCRGARVDGAMVPLNTPLQSGQTVEIVAAKDGGPSMDWLNPELGYLKSPRSRAKVRAWFNVQASQATVARGRELVDKLLQREGRTAVKLDGLAEELGFKNAEALFEAVGKDEVSLRHIENLLRPPPPAAPEEERLTLQRSRSGAGGAGGRGGVLVVGVDSLLTTLARCCRPAPPDAIGGFVTRGKGVAIHRADCTNLRNMAAANPGRLIEVKWGEGGGSKGALEPLYPIDIVVEAADRSGLLRDISEAFLKHKINVTAVNTQSARDRSTAWMTFTVEVPDAARVAAVLAQVARVPGVRHARRK
ncbi:MAG: bifunctional (p)ppGpp synthetase/guanosine-3',5'-bis(diphosphate) 3'-pyrophosphohydrolase [Rubrivivax sp.]|nr:bifunctional (p)ppGpp synthetase/guanosine-3',5'-bis(diphosphate) 3'-pyrophosphohydrolase [Rubrivivax sp.]